MHHICTVYVYAYNIPAAALLRFIYVCLSGAGIGFLSVLGLYAKKENRNGCEFSCMSRYTVLYIMMLWSVCIYMYFHYICTTLVLACWS